MENFNQQPSSFTFTNITNCDPKNTSYVKTGFTNRVRKVVAFQQSKELSRENVNANIKSSENVCPLKCKTKVSESSHDELKQSSAMPPLFRSIRKVNVDFFRGKKVCFKQSNVRISFEIVDKLIN